MLRAKKMLGKLRDLRGGEEKKTDSNLTARKKKEVDPSMKRQRPSQETKMKREY